MDSQQQQFCLKWNSFGSNLATSFSNLFKSETLADVTLFCEGVTFKAHKLILAACSKHLADLFETAPLHQNLLVILDGTSAANMSALLEFMYKGEVHVSQDALSSFLKAAECLQVKGLSIEHEKLAVAHSHNNLEALESLTNRKRLLNDDESAGQAQSSPSPSYSPAMSPYMHPHHYRQYEQRLPNIGGAAFELLPKRQIRSPNDLMQETVRGSVLRDGSRAGRPSPPSPMSLAYRPSSSCSMPMQQEADAPPASRFADGEPTASAMICPETTTGNNNQPDDPGCPEDLRIMTTLIKEEPLSTTGNGNGNDNGNNNAKGNGKGNGSSNISTSNGSLLPLTKFEVDQDTKDLVQTTLWNSVTGKLTKGGSVNTPDGKKLKCPFCERLYGYETNLRAHIRQRHQGIRVPCPFCSRTFTRNNTVRRHIAREHKTELSLKAYQQSQQVSVQQVHNHNP